MSSFNPPLVGMVVETRARLDPCQHRFPEAILANLLKNLFFCPQQKTFITLQTSQINTGQGIQGFGRSPGFLTPLMVCQKKIWEDSPDERGDSVATTVEIHIVINNDYG